MCADTHTNIEYTPVCSNTCTHTHTDTQDIWVHSHVLYHTSIHVLLAPHTQHTRAYTHNPCGHLNACPNTNQTHHTRHVCALTMCTCVQTAHTRPLARTDVCAHTDEAWRSLKGPSCRESARAGPRAGGRRTVRRRAASTSIMPRSRLWQSGGMKCGMWNTPRLTFSSSCRRLSSSKGSAPCGEGGGGKGLGEGGGGQGASIEQGGGRIGCRGCSPPARRRG